MSATEPDQLQLYPRAFSLRPNRVLFVLAIFKRVIDEKMLALQLRTSATWSASLLMYFSSQRSDHLERTIIQQTKHTQSTHRAQTENTKHKQGASQLSPEKESRVTAAFQGGAFSPFPPGSNCLFSSLLGL